MKVKTLIALLSSYPNQDAEVLVADVPLDRNGMVNTVPVIAVMPDIDGNLTIEIAD